MFVYRIYVFTYLKSQNFTPSAPAVTKVFMFSLLIRLKLGLAWLLKWNRRIILHSTLYKVPNKEL